MKYAAQIKKKKKCRYKKLEFQNVNKIGMFILYYFILFAILKNPKQLFGLDFVSLLCLSFSLLLMLNIATFQS